MILYGNRKVRLESYEDYLVLRDAKGKDTSFAVRLAGGFGKEALVYSLKMMDLMQASKPNNKPVRFTTPIGYGIIHDGLYDYLVMENLEGPTIWEVMKNGTQELSEDYADKIVAAVQDLRQYPPHFPKLDALTALGHWYPEGPIFGFEDDGGRLIDDILDFIAFMTARFQAAKVNLEAVPLTPCVLTHGELTPRNLKLCPDGTIGFLDFRRTFVGPFWWEYYTIHVSDYYPMYINPLRTAMSWHGMSVSKEIISELDNKFLPWFMRYGGAFARKEIKARIDN